MQPDMDDQPPPPPGWYARLQGDEVDLDDWRHSLNEPFDPVASKFADGETVLRSSDFDDAQSAEEVRERALILIGRLNGALGLWNGANPVRFGGVYRVDDGGARHISMFAEVGVFEMGRCVVRATAVVLGPDGMPVAPPPPTPSKPQDWNQLAIADDNISDLLDHAGRADNWYDIYKTLEIASDLMGKKRNLEKMFTRDEADIELLRASANFYRHARGHRPPNLLSLPDARPILAYVVRKVLDRIQSS